MNNESKTHINYDISVTSVIDNIPLEDIDMLPDECGVYIITFLCGRKYVGSTKTLRTRLNYHRESFNGEYQIKLIRVYLVEDVFDSRILEKILIKDIKPEVNKRDLFPVQESEVVKISKDLYDEIKKIQASLYSEYDIRVTIGNIVKIFIEKAKEQENITEWLSDSIKAEKEEKDKKKELVLSE
ncbi:MAG: GIY-YIG nuclease family protein [Candidatus Dojkabacteria bacterium]|nr:GIY-YIG nuclease family protein [Candidatus Dojkabacteria bacterium]